MTISYQECREEQRPLSCETSSLRVPYQPKIHRVKCLLSSGNDAPDLDVEESDAAAVEKLNEYENQAKRKRKRKRRSVDE